MTKIADLFRECVWETEYSQIGDSVNYAFVEKGRTLKIFFQGSNSITDWVRNFWFKKKPYKDMEIPYRVHAGFLAAWKEVEDLVIAKITERNRYGAWERKWKKIIVVGYSHGAALAGLCHECVWFHRPDLREKGLEGYGFESPRFYGCFKVKERLRERWEKFTVVRTNSDIVTHCPPSIFGFCHVGNLLKTKGDVSLCPKQNLPKCVKSHYPEVVIDGLEKFESLY